MDVFQHGGDCNRKLQLFNRYQVEVIGVSIHDRRTGAAKLRGSITNYLCQVEPKSRLNPAIQQVFDENIQADPMWNLTTAGRTFRHFEKYALNLLTFPWKREFWRVRSYSGFLKTQIEPFLNSYETLFSLIGYCFNEENASFEIVDPPLTTAVQLYIAKMAFELFVADVECEVLDTIFNSVNHLDSFTVADVYLSRSTHSGSVEYFINRVAGDLRKSLPKSGVNSHQNLWCCTMCSNKNPVHTDVCQSCFQPDFDIVVPGQPVRTVERYPIRDKKNFIMSAVPIDVTKRPQSPSTQEKGEYLTQKISPVENYNDPNKTSCPKTSFLSTGKKSHQKTWQCEECGYENLTMISPYCSRCNTFYDATDSSSLVQEKRQSKLSELPDQKNYSSRLSPPGTAANERENSEGAVQKKVVTRRDLSSSGNSYGVSIVQLKDKEENLWKCMKCNMSNKVENEKCRTCGCKRLDDKLEHLSGHLLNSDQRHNHSKVRHGNKTLADLGLHDNVKPEQPIVWQCAWCTFANDPKIDICKICQNLRHTRPADSK